MHTLLRLAVAAILALLTAGQPCMAQGASDSFPEPMNSGDMEASLDRIGLQGDQRVSALKAFEDYVQRCLDLRKNDIEEYVRGRPDFGSAPPREEVVARVDRRRQLLKRFASIEQGLFDSIQSIAGESAATAIERERMRAERRRDWSVANSFLTRGARIDLADLAAQALDQEPPPSIDREALGAALLSIERQQTALMRKLAELAVEEPIAFHDARAASPMSPPADGGNDPEAWRSMIESRRKIAAAVRAPQVEVRQKLRRLLRDGSAQIEQSLPSDARPAFHQAFLNKAYPQAANPRDPVPGLLSEARKKSDAGDLTKEEFATVQSTAIAHAERRRALDRRIMDALDEEAASGNGSAFRFEMLGSEEEATPSPTEKLLTERATLDSETIRAITGVSPALKELAAASEARRGPQVEVNGVGLEIVTEEFVGTEGGGVMVMSVAGDDIGGDFGDAVVAFLDTDAVGTSRSGTPAPLTKADIDGIVKRFQVSPDEAAILALLHEDYVARWREVDQGELAELKELPSEFAMPVHGGGPPSASDIARRFELRRVVLDRLLALDTEFFDGVGAAISSSISQTDLGALRRERIREALIAAERGGGFMGMEAFTESASPTADLTRIVRGAGLSEEARATIAGRLMDWDLAATDAYRQRYEIRLEAQRKQAEFDSRFAMASGDGNEREVRISSDMADFEAMQANAKRAADANKLTATLNESAMAGLLDALAGTTDQRTLEDAWDRAVWPSLFRDRSDVEPRISKALGLPDLAADVRAAIESIAAEHRAEYRRVCKEMIAANQKSKEEQTRRDGSGMDVRAIQARQDTMSRLRFERTELNQKTLRRIKEQLSPEQAEIVGDLPKPRQQPSFQFSR